MTTITWILDWLFGCHHDNLSRVWTIKAKRYPYCRETYRTCLDCGRRTDYDWERMRTLGSGMVEGEGKIVEVRA